MLCVQFITSTFIVIVYLPGNIIGFVITGRDAGSYTELNNRIINFSGQTCGITSIINSTIPIRHEKIVGGAEAAYGEFPWIVTIRQMGNHLCSGVVVNDDWILTAAHCFCTGSLFISEKKFDVQINYSGDRSLPSQTIDIFHVYIHPDYTCLKLGNDIALLKLSSSIHPREAVPACFLPPGKLNPIVKNATAVAAGWGATNEDISLGGFPTMLHKVSLPILENEECQVWYRSKNKKLHLTKSEMCAGLKEGAQDTCWADSGGPLMINDELQVLVVGIVSTGIGCARPSLPGIYTRISEYFNWMTDVISLEQLQNTNLRT